MNEQSPADEDLQYDDAATRVSRPSAFDDWYYGIEDALFTTCRCPPGRDRRPWEIAASSAERDKGSNPD